MNVIQEDTVRQLHLKHNQTEIHIKNGDYVTQQARDYIKDMRLTLVVDGASAENRDIHPAAEMASGRFVTADGRALAAKPEHMTHLHGNVLVPKNHPRIILRGKLDSLEAEIVLLQARTHAAGKETLTAELEELLDLCRTILGCEVTGKPLPELTLLGLDGAALREQSHHPREHFGVGHLLPGYRLGEVSAALNRLRTQAREVELAAVDAFCRPDGTAEREDLLRALNRLSSAFYILMLRREREKGNAHE